MTTAVTQAPMGFAPPQDAARTGAHIAPVAHAPGLDPMDFVRDNRIQVKFGSLFIDPYLVIHPRELDPANEEKLRRKLTLTYGIDNPSFFESADRTAIALNLGQLIPVSFTSRRSKLMEEVKKFNDEVQSGADGDLTRQAGDKQKPFAAIVRDTLQNPEANAADIELLKNGLAFYLLAREKLTQNHYLGRLTDYVQRSGTPDQVLSDLTDKIGATPRALREAALKDGLAGVGKLLGLDPRYVADVKTLTEQLAHQDFGYNPVEHWHIGRQLLGIDAPLQQKITVGMDARITAKIDEYRRRVKQYYDVPEPIKPEEKRIAQALELVEPIQRKLLYALGYEICYSPEVTADDIAFHKGIYGLHRKTANDLSDFRGTYRIYFSGKGDLEGSMRTLTHEIAHNLWPDHFSKDDVAKIDRHAAEDAARFSRFARLVDEKFPESRSCTTPTKWRTTARRPPSSPAPTSCSSPTASPPWPGCSPTSRTRTNSSTWSNTPPTRSMSRASATTAAATTRRRSVSAKCCRASSSSSRCATAAIRSCCNTWRPASTRSTRPATFRTWSASTRTC